MNFTNTQLKTVNIDVYPFNLTVKGKFLILQKTYLFLFNYIFNLISVLNLLTNLFKKDSLKHYTVSRFSMTLLCAFSYLAPCASAIFPLIQ